MAKLAAGDEVTYIIDYWKRDTKNPETSVGTLVWISSNGRFTTIKDLSRPVKNFKGIDEYEHNVAIDQIKK